MAKRKFSTMDKSTIDYSKFTQCAITADTMTDPVFVSCGHTFEHAAIVQWMRRSSTCPVCRRTIAPTLTPNHLARSLVEHGAPPGTLQPRTTAEIMEALGKGKRKLVLEVQVQNVNIVKYFRVWPKTTLKKIRTALLLATGIEVELSYGGVDLTDEYYPTVASTGVGEGGVLTAHVKTRNLQPRT